MSNRVDKVEEEVQQTSKFINSEETISRAINADNDSTYMQSDFVNGDLADFFARPILVATQKWTVAPFSFSFNPWTTFLSNPAVERKISNYQLIRMKLHVKYIINSTPFLYGRAVMAYTPMGGYRMASQQIDTEMVKYVLTQAPHVFIDPAGQKSGELCLPFFFPDNYLEINQASPSYGVSEGTIYCESMNDLRAATANAHEDITISFYLWATDVELVIPTSTVAVTARMQRASVTQNQSKIDVEYQPQGLISSVAAGVANTAGLLRNVPIISSFARSVEIGSNLLGGAAAFFGFSRPVNVEAISPMKPLSLSSIANIAGVETATKLTFDPKQETTVDASITGVENIDYMNFAYIVGRESYVSNFTWTLNDLAGDALYYFDVSPMMGLQNNATGTGSTGLSMVPVAYASLPFKYWSGTLVYRLQIICSKYHKGRIKIAYEPVGNPNQANEYNTMYNHIVDIQDCNDYEFSVSWAQHSPYKLLQDPRDPQRGVTPTAYSALHSNGRVYITVINELSAPVIGADVEINLYMRAGEDYETCVPCPRGTRLTPYDFYYDNGPAALTEETNELLPVVAKMQKLKDDTSNVFSLVGEPNVDILEHKSLIFHADPIKSIRALLKRYDRLETTVFPTQSYNNSNMYQYTLYRNNYPSFGGTSPNGNFNTGVTNYQTPLIAYFTMGYAGYRGGLRTKYFIDGNGCEPQNIFISRFDGIIPTIPNRNSLAALPQVVNTDVNSANYFTNLPHLPRGIDGNYCSHNQLSRGHEVELPYYSNKRFAYTPIYDDFASLPDIVYEMNHVLTFSSASNGAGMNTSQARTLAVHRYISTAEDFNLIWFVNVPIMTCDSALLP